MLINEKVKLIMCASLMFTSFLANAICSIVTPLNTGGFIQIGTSNPITISGLQFQPAGTQLSQDYISGAQMAEVYGITAETVIFRCALSDASQIFEGYYVFRAYDEHLTPAQTIGGIPYWAMWITGANNTPISGVNFEFFLGNGVSAGTAFNNQPNRTKRIGYDIDPKNSNYILIKGKHFSGVTNRQVRSNVAVTASGFNPVIPPYVRGFVYFKGPGINEQIAGNLGFGAPEVFSFFTVGLRGTSTTAVNSCYIEKNDTNVQLGSHSANALPSTPVNFSVTVKCDAGSTGIYYGFAPGIENISKNVTDVLLLDSNMGSTAKGVAIEILNSNNTKIPLLNLAATGGVISNTNNWQSLSIPSSGAASSVNVAFSARIVRYGSEAVVPGIVRSKATFMLNKH
ncbi:fimbrial protein [Providencia sp. PROV188]|uniref:fimbrial protein n=1 Tax=unclassified Providencia TaxID=2633465 RepID=UPI0012B5DA96|nr:MULTISPECIES: fimbrial protein [unclassified Providencia]MTB45328.1 fimbrial protein [Providencia sp. wls1950]MTC23248.1 fimbrial protein [Providencia sp. wls1938]MTC47298.1 fimbrial protein [Providencia sp. wls1922]MTC78301.1 fimbrial protein [Providencia sp. wls1916]WBM60996.1 fimbrial protein [Providencia sp. PROV188]